MINKRKLQSLIYQLFCMFVGLAVISPIIYNPSITGLPLFYWCFSAGE